MKSSLRLAEWLLSFTVLFLLSSLYIIAKISSFRSQGDMSPPVRSVEITVLGHVSNPGVYSVDIGTPLLEAFVEAKPKPYANLAVYSEGRVRGVETFEICVLDALSIHVSGACLPGAIRVPVGARLGDLKEMLVLAEGADLSFFKKRRLLKDQENIKIPLKK